MNLLLVRHGQTVENKSSIILGQNDGTLNDAGKECAKKLSFMLKKYDIDIVYVSDLKRCIDTATIALSNKLTHVIKDKRIREINFGAFQGQPYSNIKEDYLSDLTKKFPGGESNSELITRVINFVNEIYGKHKDSTVLVVTHSGPINTIISSLEGVKYKDNIENKIGHCELVELIVRKKLDYPQ